MIPNVPHHHIACRWMSGLQSTATATSPLHRDHQRLPPAHRTDFNSPCDHELTLFIILETIHVRFEHDHIEKHCIHHQVPWKNWSYAKPAPLDSHTQNVDPTEMSWQRTLHQPLITH